MNNLNFISTKKIIALSIAVILLFSIILPFTFGLKNVQANENIIAEDVAIHYISDYLISEDLNQRVEFLNNLLAQSTDVVSATIIPWENYANNTLTYDFEAFFNIWYNSPETDVSYLYGTYLIFDLHNGFIKDNFYYPNYYPSYDIYMDSSPRNGVYFTETLKNFFSELYLAETKIMFICDTDEYVFSNNTEFLDYVDIHVNTDLETVFFDSIFYIINADDYYSYDNYNVAIILDSYYSNNYYLFDYVVRYFSKITSIPYEDTVNTSEYGDRLQYYLNMLYQLRNITVIGSTPEGMYVDFLTGEPFDASYIDQYLDYEDEYGNTVTRRIYAIGSTWSSTSLSWLNDMLTLRSYKNYDFPIFVDIRGQNIDDIEEQYPNIYTLGAATYYYDTTLRDMIIDFVCGNDLSGYNLWVGRCPVSYKPIVPGSGGWIRIPCNDWECPWWMLA